MKSTQNLIKASVSAKTLQFDECRVGAMTQDFMKSWVIAPPPPAPPQTKEFLLKHLIYKVFSCKIHQISCEIRMKSAGFQNYELLRHDQV